MSARAQAAAPRVDPSRLVSQRYLVMADGRLQALAGGDVRFGLSRDYDSDHVIARFAIVRRERMVAW